MINYGKQTITSEDIQAVVNVLKSDFLTQGPVVPAFEQAVAGKVNARYGVAVNSATSALHLACAALGVGSGDIIWTVPNTFVASANCGLYCGANVDFVDIDPCTWNISVEKFKDKLSESERDGKLPKAIIPVHFAGQPTEQDKIYELSKAFGVSVIEDASHAIGAEYKSEPVGSCRWSDITVFSFHPVKIITTGEGGMALTNNGELANKMKLLRNHGITRDPDKLIKQNPEPWYYEQQALGWNYRMTDIAAALGLSQLSRTSEYVSIRNQLAERYTTMLADLPLQLQMTLPELKSSYHLYVILVDCHIRKTIFDKLLKNKVGVNVHYMPVHLQPFFQNMGFQKGMFPIAEDYALRSITLPLNPSLTEAQQNKIISLLREALIS